MSEQAAVSRVDAAAPSAAGAQQRRWMLVGMFVVYLVLLTWGVLYKFGTWFGVDDVRRVIKLLPFAPGAGLGASQPAEVLANLLLFLPFGVFLGLVAPRWGWMRLVAVVAGASILFETTQYVLAIGNSDITDVIVNTAGGLVGIGALVLARRRLGDRADRVMTRVLGVVLVLAVLAIAAFLMSPIHFGPPHGDRLPPLDGAPGAP